LEHVPSTSSSPGPTPAPREPEPLFTWLHLSDIHFGHHDVEHRWDQRLVLAALREDLAASREQNLPKPDVILVTGDIAFAGIAPQYAEALAWLRDIAAAVDLDLNHVYTVPGNHDVERAADKDRSIKRLVGSLREGTEQLDSALTDPGDSAMIRRRQQHYLDFASSLAAAMSRSPAGPAPLFWTHSVPARGGLRVRLCGLNTAILAADDNDRTKLRLGKQQLAESLTNPPIEGREIAVVLSHHPFQEDWLADQGEALKWLRRYAQIHLCGHVHESDHEVIRSGGGGGITRIVAGAVHGDKLPAGVPASHGYNIASLVQGEDNTLKVRVYPRRFSNKNGDFRLDTDNVPKGATFAEHGLPLRRA
jgi:3',5'-cyclic AMP phosphodiesterase CpdA